MMMKKRFFGFGDFGKNIACGFPCHFESSLLQPMRGLRKIDPKTYLKMYGRFTQHVF